MVSIQLLTTAWTVWKAATTRVGPVGGFLITAIVIGSLVYLSPRDAENDSSAAEVAEDPYRPDTYPPDEMA